MNKLLLLLSMIAVDYGCNSSSMLIAQTQSEAKASPSATASAAAEDENNPQVLKTSPSGKFRIVEKGEGLWIVTAADENQRTKMHSAELVIPEEFRFSPDEKWLYVELHHGSCMSGADLYRKSNSKAAGPNEVGPFQPIEPALEYVAWAEAVDPLPDEATLKQRYAAVDKKLNENYQKMIAKAEKEEKETVANLRRFQRQWLKARDAGLKIYLAAFSPAEKERRRLQFLID